MPYVVKKNMVNLDEKELQLLMNLINAENAIEICEILDEYDR